MYQAQEDGAGDTFSALQLQGHTSARPGLPRHLHSSTQHKRELVAPQLRFVRFLSECIVWTGALASLPIS